MTVRSTIFGLIAAAFCLIAAMPPPAYADPLKVMSFNVRLPLDQDGPNNWQHRRDLFVATIKNARPDVIGTQELHQEQGGYVIDHLPDYAWFGTDRRGGHSDEHMGVFYRRDRLRIVDLGNFWLSDTPDVPGSITWRHPYPRMVTWGLFERLSDGKRFYFYDTHFPYRDEDEPAREKAATLIASRVAALSADLPFIMTGDFNTTPESNVHTLLTATLTDTRLAAPTPTGPAETFHDFTGKADHRIDWILTRGATVKGFQTITDHRGSLYPSDHFPVMTELDF